VSALGNDPRFEKKSSSSLVMSLPQKIGDGEDRLRQYDDQ
jgi:hypothetical protein